jgi:hypothetical protein
LRNLIIYGGGEAGRQIFDKIIGTLPSRYHILGFVDDGLTNTSGKKFYRGV